MNECDIWPGATDDRGYARTTRNKKTVLVHRLAYEEEHGPIPKGLLVHHTCENPSCRNVEHLVLMTKKEHQMHHLTRAACSKCGCREFYYSGGRKIGCRECTKARVRARV